MKSGAIICMGSVSSVKAGTSAGHQLKLLRLCSSLSRVTGVCALAFATAGALHGRLECLKACGAQGKVLSPGGKSHTRTLTHMVEL